MGIVIYSTFYGVIIKKHLGDKVLYKSKEFTNESNKKYRDIDICGVGFHHQQKIIEIDYMA